VSEGPGWERYFERVGQIPGGTPTTPKRLTEKELLDRQAEINRGNAANIAVAMGGVDTGSDFDPWDWLSGWSTNVEQNLTLNTEAIVELQDVQASMNTTLSYVGDEEQMVSVPRSQLTIPTIGGSSTPPKARNLLDPVEFVYSGVYHHSVLPVFRPDVVIGETEGTIYYVPIIADRKGAVEGISWVGGADTSIFSIDYYEVALCVYNPDTGNIEKAWGSGNVKDTYASVADPDYIYMTIGTPQSCTPGQLLFAAFQQTAPGGLQTARYVGAAPAVNIARSSAALIDAWCFTAADHSQGIPSSISFAGLGRENRFIPFAGLRVAAEGDEP
jgi:hypothetical protein